MIINHNENIGSGFNYTIMRLKNDTLSKILKESLYVMGIGETLINEWIEKCLVNPTKEMEKAVCLIMKGIDIDSISEINVNRVHNLVPNVQTHDLARIYAGTAVAQSFGIKYIALGSSTTTPAAADTQLGTETLRDLYSDRSSLNGVTYVDKFFTAVQVGGNTYKEIGMVVDGSLTENSGYLASHAAINETPAADETIIVNATMTFSG